MRALVFTPWREEQRDIGNPSLATVRYLSLMPLIDYTGRYLNESIYAVINLPSMALVWVNGSQAQIDAVLAVGDAFVIPESDLDKAPDIAALNTFLHANGFSESDTAEFSNGGTWREVCDSFCNWMVTP